HVLCPANAKCVNNTHCTCLDGYQTHGNRFFNDTTEICDDIDECQGPNPADCGPHANCTNVPGSYSCTCIPGYEPSSGKANFTHASENTCQGELSPDPTWLFLSCPQNVTLRFNALLNSTSFWDGGDKGEVVSALTFLLQSVEQSVLATALQSPKNTTQNMTTESMGEGGRVALSRPQLPNEGSSPLPAGLGAAAFISYSYNLDSIINVTLPSEGNLPAGGKLGKSYLNSRVVSGAIGDGRPINLSRPAHFTLQAHCVYWKVEAESGSWSPDGCTAVNRTSTHTTCRCDHLSSFSILMALTTESYPLTIITYVGLTLSLLCLFLAILTFLLCRSIRNVSTSLHLQLCLCLFLADLLFLIPVTRTGSPVACAVIAGLLHYLFLACFSWMLLEGLHLFLTIRNLKVLNYTSASRFKKRFMYPFGYGFPALVVAISAAVNPDGYRTSEQYVQRPSRRGAGMWLPCINITFFTLTLWILRNSLSSLNADVSTLRDHRLLTFKAIAQLFILGCTWSLGLLQVGAAATVMAYLFTIVNSLQGAFIFLVHCLLNRQVMPTGFRTFSIKSQTYDLSMSAVPTTSTKTVRGSLLCSNTSL
uniref:Uncharacterized protein n=1 Tax=Chrysemys picta bellii TaxID=8478 RepID=A0A8C3P953_CHRPI